MQPSYPARTLDELVQKSALIVHAKKIGENPARMDDRLDAAVTDYHFEVLDIYHGDKKVGDTITVEFDYGTVDGTAYGSGAYRVLENGREALMILSYPTDAEDEITTTERYVFYPPGGIFYGTGDGQFQALNGKVFTPSAFKEKVTTVLENVIK